MNEIINTPATIPSTELQDLSNYLNDISVTAPKLHLSILPNIISDCAAVFMEYKKMKIDNKQFNQKCRLLNQYIQGQARNQEISIKLNHRQKMHEIEIYKTTKLAEIDAQKEVAMAKIEHDTMVSLETIKSNERIKIKEMQVDYELKRRDQDYEFYKFKENMKEEARRFDKQYKMIKNEQSDRHNFIKELQKTCSFIGEKIQKGKADANDIKNHKYLLQLQIMAFKEGFNFTHSVYAVFRG